MTSLALVFVLASGLAHGSGERPASAEEAVRATEVAFAKSMADRNHAGFTSFLDPEAVFLGGKEILRGASQVAEGWRKLFDAPQAPFSWEPERVAVIDSGSLATSTGPIRDPSGKQIGTFVSTWRRNDKGEWRIVLDSGCRCPESETP